MKDTILVIAAHPDDEVLGCGSTILRLAQEGHEVYIAILGEGITSRYKQRKDAEMREVEKLKKTSRKAGRMLGAKKVFFFALPDNRFDTVPLLDVVKKIEGLITKLKPSVVFTHHSSDLNIDHSLVHRAVLTATRPTAGMPVKSIYMFEIPSATEWAFGQFKPVFCPNVFYDIGQFLDAKLEALQLYESESRNFPHPRSKETLISLSRKWGSMAGVRAAEAFELIRSIK